MTAMLFMVPLGIQEATCGVIGNCIGADNVPLAKRFFSIITKFTISIVTAMGLMTYFARNKIAAFYTEEESVQALCSQVLIITSCLFLFDGMQGYLQGPIRAMGL